MRELVKTAVVALISTIFALSCQNQTNEMIAVNAPVAKKLPTELKKHGDVRVDNYYWLNDRENEDVIAYLEKENEYYQALTAHTKDFREQLFEEMKGRIKEDDSSVPYKRNGFWYITRYEKGGEYPIFSRKKGSLDAEEQVMFNCNELAKGHEFFNLRGVSVSPDNRLAAFGTDTVSRRQYYIQIKNLETGEIYPDKIENTTGSAAWADDNKTLFYTKKDPVTLRSDKIYKHKLGTSADEDELVFHEEDETFSAFVYKSKSRKYIIIGSYSTLTSEYQILEASKPDGAFRVFTPRERGLEYNIYHYEDHFYVLTNKDGATNFKLMKTAEGATASSNWEEFVPHREKVLLDDVEIFKDYYVLSERDNGLNKLKITRWDGKDSYYL
ncbi:MAG: oligopeptidase B, partial [Bacteroidota bacterium]